MKVYCDWCGWIGDIEECDMDEHDVPCYCPNCEHDWVRPYRPDDATVSENEQEVAQ